jgi:hypothetical protein
MEKPNIISFSGKLLSGKDTVANMITEITKKRLEKDIGGRFTVEYDGYEWKIKKFSYKLKQVASLLTGIPVEKFEDQEFKKSLLGKEWGTVSHTPLNDIEPFKDIECNVLMDIRTFLQKTGTDAIRNGLHKDTWINSLWCDYKEGDKWIITDTRFINEIESVKKRGGIVVRLTRNSDVVSTHVSETELDDYKFDYVIDNKDDTLEETYEKIKEFCEYYKLI